VSSDDLERLLRWEASGGTWLVQRRTPGALTVNLLTCGGDETMDVFSSTAVDLVEHVGSRSRMDDDPGA
jgi:hypothetical protein